MFCNDEYLYFDTIRTQWNTYAKEQYLPTYNIKILYSLKIKIIIIKNCIYTTVKFDEARFRTFYYFGTRLCTIFKYKWGL